MLRIPTFVATLVASDEEDRGAVDVEGEKKTPGIALLLDSQLLHVRILRTLNRVRTRTSQVGLELPKQSDMSQDLVLKSFIESSKPLGEFLIEEYVPFHG